MRRCAVTFLFGALTFALVGSVKGQDSSSQKKMEYVKYPVSGSEDATGEIQTVEDRELLNDFYQSKVQEQLHQAVVTNDAAKFDPLLADQMTWIAERFGKGIILTKAQVLDDF